MKIIKLSGEVGWDIVAEDFSKQLDESTGDIMLHIDSPGGSVFQGVQIFNAIRDYKNGTIIAVVNSLAASIASYFALAADEVHAYDNSTYMIHNASTWSWGDFRELRKSADIVEGLTNLLIKAYVAKTGKPKSDIIAMLNDETYLFGEEILQNGFVDKILDSETENDKSSLVAVNTNKIAACVGNCKGRFEDEREKVAALLMRDVVKNKYADEADKIIKGFQK